MKFYPRDWRGDQALRAVSLAARGLWIECLCIMHEAKPYGHLVLNGSPVDGGTLARMTGITVDEATAFLAELRQAGVLSVTGKGVVFSRRMTKDHARAQKGRKAANKRWSQASGDVEQSDEPNGSANGLPITQKPETREQKEYKPLAQQPIAAAPRNKFDDILDKLLAANGIVGFRAEKHPGLMNLAPIIGLDEAGLDLDRDILPAIRAKPNPEARKWDYFVPQIREYVQRRQSAASVLFSPPKPEDWVARLKVWREGGVWGAWGPRPGEAGCRVPPELLQAAA